MACDSTNNNVVYVSQKDTLLKQYFAELDSFPYYDTTQLNYQMLRAYYHNDTNVMRNINLALKQEKEYDRFWSEMDTCIHQEKLQDLDVDEAYRFIYLPAFCSMSINVTITKKGDSSKLNFLLYQITFDTMQCRILSKFDKSLTRHQWEEFRSKMQWGDIWGLKRENGSHGVDGTNLTFIAYQNGQRWDRADKINYGRRWVYSSLDDALTFILKISGNKKGCYWVQ